MNGKMKKKKFKVSEAVETKAVNLDSDMKRKRLKARNSKLKGHNKEKHVKKKKGKLPNETV